jgi:hypothetical protein
MPQKKKKKKKKERKEKEKSQGLSCRTGQMASSFTEKDQAGRRTSLLSSCSSCLTEIQAERDTLE